MSEHPATILLVGPTASGKSALALALAQRCSVEIVSADSMQVYRRMDVGTAKPRPEERAAVPHHLIDIVEPTDAFSVRDWLGRADAVIGDIASRQRTPVVVGGTHLYAKAFLEGLFEAPADPDVRAELAAREPASNRADLERVDPAAAQRIHPNDRRRTVRALEVHRITGMPISDLQSQWDAGRHRVGTTLVALEWRNEPLARRINARVKRMVERGLVEEVRGLWHADQLGRTAREAVGYKQLIDHFEGRASLAGAIEQIKVDTRRLAKNQRTWLRRLRTTPGAIYLDAESLGSDPAGAVERIIKAIDSRSG